MPITLDYRDIALRLALTFAAAAILGFNRGERGQPAGLRTTILVTVAAAASMIQVNLLLILSQQRQSLVELDLMRLPLGILSGMGFIGAGAILRKGELVHGVTTAATLWYATVMGLCFGGGQFVLGAALLGIGVVVLWALKWVEIKFVHERRATLKLTIADGGPSEHDVRKRLEAGGFRVVRCTVRLAKSSHRTIRWELRWRSPHGAGHTPALVEALAAQDGVRKMAWAPT